jgi:predicted  nucleic acid-binding Zn-ribbon protein
MPADNKPKRTRLEEIRFELERHAKRLEFEVEAMEHYQNFHEEMLEKAAQAHQLSDKLTKRIAELERRLAELRERLTNT